MSEEFVKYTYQANENKLLWRQVLVQKNKKATEETCVGQFGFLPTDDGKSADMVFIVHKDNEPEHAIAIPKEVLQTALTEGWFLKRGNGR
tara:strand:+ start:337 stop:606 length:270 start_codon:yes stop_codon:yes gene_type:complete